MRIVAAFDWSDMTERASTTKRMYSDNAKKGRATANRNAGHVITRKEQLLALWAQGKNTQEIMEITGLTKIGVDCYRSTYFPKRIKH